MALKLSTLRYDINIVFSIIAVGFILLFIDIKAALIGYGIIGFCTLGILFLLFAIFSQGQLKENTMTLIRKIAINSTPTLLILISLSWLIAMNVIHYDKITSNTLSDDYITFLNIANVLLIVQYVCLKYFISDQLSSTKYAMEGNSILSKTNQLLSSYSSMLLYLFSTLNFIVLGICQVILQYYSTDG